MKNKKKEILNEMKKNKGGFQTPANYFRFFEKNFPNQDNRILPGYKIPASYFSQLEEKIINRSKDIYPSKSTGFKIPKNYLNEFDNIFYKRKLRKTSKIFDIASYKNIKVVSFSVAASLLLFFGLNNFVFDKNEYDIETIEVAQIENWLDEDLISFNSYDIAETFSDVELVIENDYSDEILDLLDYTDIENIIIEN
jgi:hypothetical protein